MAQSHTEVLDRGRYGTVRRTVLDSGLRVVTEAVPAARSACVGIYAAVGSRDETPELAGASHFLEHLLFKGTSRRSAWQISAEIEVVGGDSNAYTTKEHTCFHTQVLNTDLPLAVDVLCDMITSSVIGERELDVERGVIIEEIAMREDEPSDLSAELFDCAALGEHSLARPILGTAESISALTREQVYRFYREHYRPENLVVAVAGNLEHDEVVDLVAAGFSVHERDSAAGSCHERGKGGPCGHVRGAASTGCSASTGNTVPVVPGGRIVRRKDTEQAHLTLGVPGLHRYDERRYALSVLSQVLGGGMSSRLFQEIRERRGLAYAVNTFVDCYSDVGFFGVYAGCSPAKLDEVTELIVAELERVAKHGLSQDEVTRGKGMISGATVLDTEDPSSRMSRIGHRELCYPDYVSVDDYLGRIRAVTADDVAQLAAQLLVEPYIVGLVVPSDSAQLDSTE